MAFFSKLLGRRSDVPAQAPSILTPTQFADHYVAMVKERAPEIEAERVENAVRLRWPDGGTMTEFLKNAYSQYLKNPDELEPVLEAQLSASRATAAMQDGLDLDIVLPLIKSQAWLVTATAQTQGRADFVVKPLVSDLIVVFAQNLPDIITYVKTGDLAEVCDESQLAERAIANLSARLDSLKVAGGGGRYRIELDGFFDASLILVAAKWLGAVELQGDPVFAIPSRDQLLVCGSDNDEAVLELAEIAGEIVASDAYDITDQLLILRNATLQPLMLER